MGNVWFTSDLHLGHRAVAWIREYGTWKKDKAEIPPEVVARHSALLAENWDVSIKKDDVVWVLGDLTANNSHLPDALDWIRQRPGIKHLVLGNHDPAHPMHSESHKWEPLYDAAFASVGTARTRKITLHDGVQRRVLLSHFPYQGDRQTREDRDVAYRLRDTGLPLLHGHTHEPTRLTHTVDGTPQLHIGVDAWYYFPVSLEQVVDRLSTALGIVA